MTMWPSRLAWRELLARVRSVLRRREESAPRRSETLSFLGFTVVAARRQVKAPNW